MMMMYLYKDVELSMSDCFADSVPRYISSKESLTGAAAVGRVGFACQLYTTLNRGSGVDLP